MRRVAIAASLLLSCALLPPASTPPLELCLRAFPEMPEGESVVAWVLVPVLLPLVWIFGPERIVNAFGYALAPFARRHAERQLSLLRRAADQGHLPSRYLLAETSRRHRQQQNEQVEGLLEPITVRGYFLELAGAGFPPGEVAAAEEAAEAGFSTRRYDFLRPEELEYYRAASRFQFFGLATRAGWKGSQQAWSELALRYEELIDRFETTGEDRAQGYAWTYLATLPVDDFDRKPEETARRERRREEAWNRLRDDAERDRARELARRFEAEVFPRRIPASTEREVCAVEPQFGQGVTEVPGLYNPIRLPPPYGPGRPPAPTPVGHGAPPSAG